MCSVLSIWHNSTKWAVRGWEVWGSGGRVMHPVQTSVPNEVGCSAVGDLVEARTPGLQEQEQEPRLGRAHLGAPQWRLLVFLHKNRTSAKQPQCHSARVFFFSQGGNHPMSFMDHRGTGMVILPGRSTADTWLWDQWRVPAGTYVPYAVVTNGPETCTKKVFYDDIWW